MATILLVEDDAATRRIIETVLRRRGYKVCMPVAEPFGAGAIRLLETEQIDAVILDLLLGPTGFDGFEVARRMRDHFKWRDIPIFLASGLDATEINRKAGEYAFSGLRTCAIGKPLDEHLLFAELEKLIVKE